MNAHAPSPPAPPIGLLVELTHRCPLGCPYCSNPLALERPGAELDGETWKRVFSEAAALGALHVHLSGGEPTARRDIAELTRHASRCGLYTNLITSGIGVSEKLMGELVEAGLDHAQLSFQGADKETNDRLGHYDGSWERKRAFAAMVTKAGLPLTLNAVIHRANLSQVGAFIDLAVELGARRLEVAHTQYYGWALANRAALMPPKAEVDESIAWWRRLARASRASSSSTWWFPTITRAIPSLARAAGDGSRSMSRPRARLCRAMPPRRFRASNSGTCAIIRSTISGATIRPSRLFAEPNGCSSPAARATGARSTGAAAAARRWR